MGAILTDKKLHHFVVDGSWPEYHLCCNLAIKGLLESGSQGVPKDIGVVIVVENSRTFE